MAEIKPRIGLENRTLLQDVIPLSTPYLVFLDPSDICNAKCQWCPTGSGEALKYKKPQLMDFDLYKKIIDDLCEMPDPIKTLRLYKDGEPLLNRDLPKMIQYAKDSGRFGQIDTTTNGIALTPKLGKKLVDAGLDKIFISVPSDYTEEYRDQVCNFIVHKGSCKIYVKIIGDHLDNLGREIFYNDFQDADRAFIEYLSPCWPEFDVGKVGNIGIYGQPIKEVWVCPYIFYSLAINSDGTVSLCFLDWKHGMILGDLAKESFKSIWQGHPLTMIRKAHLIAYRDFFKPCRKCGQLTYGAPDDIDQYSEEILKRL
ncbi:MAG: radical SAM/SPASM domain-containing protein [Eubacteriales bacterium]|jgi:MoaA/NifB/PqqE/SkfB family radical SAM enzyme